MGSRIVKLSIVLFGFAVIGLGYAYSQETTQRSVGGLEYDLKHPEADRRKAAAKALGTNKVRQSVPALIEATNDGDPAVRLEVVTALVTINDTRALDAYIALTKDSDRAIQSKAVEGILSVYVRDDAGFWSSLKKAAGFVNPLSSDYNPLIVEPYMPVSERGISAIADLLNSSDAKLRKEAAAALGILRGQSALPAIEGTLEREKDNAVKVELIRAIYKIGDVESGKALVPLIRDPDKKVHDEAIFAVGGLRVREAVGPLEEIYRAGVEERKKIFAVVPVSGVDDLQKRVLEALAYLGDPSSKDIFEDSLEDQRELYRRFGAEGLGRIGDPVYTSLIAKKHLREKSGSTKLAMGFALYRLGRDEHLIEMVDNVTSDQTYYYLLEMEPREVPRLYPFLQSEKDAVKIRLLDVIGQRGDAAALQVVEEYTQDPNADIVSAANLAKRRLGSRFRDR